MDAFELLKQDHRKTQQLLDQLHAAQDSGTRERLFAEIKSELDAHTEIEEELFYPWLQHVEQTADQVRESLEEHDRVKQLLDRMQGMSKDGPAWTSSVEELRDNVQHHVREEEDELMPKAEAVLSAAQRDELGERLQDHKQRIQQEPVSFAGVGGRSQERRDIDMDEVRERARSKAEEWRQSAAESGRGFASEQARSAAAPVHGLAEAFRTTAGSLHDQNQPQLSRLIEQAAEGLDRVSRNLEHGDVDAFVARTSDFARRQPAVFLGGAVTLGFLMTRFLKSSEQRAGYPHEGSHI